MHWATHLYRRALRTLRPLRTASRRPKRARLRFEALEHREVPAVAGTVFVDLNQDGIQDVDDAGAAGVTVKATDASGTVETAITAADGTYTLQTAATSLRLQFSNFPEGTYAGRIVGTSGPATRFLDAASDRTEVNLSLASPQLVTTQFFYDHAIEGANSGEGAVLAVPYGVTDTAFPNVLATVADVGSVWGVGFQPGSNSIYVSSFLKRHAGFGPNAAGTGTTTGGIYRIDQATTPATVSMLIDLNTAGAGFATGTDPHPTISEADGGDWFHDSAALPLVGKRGLGGLQVSSDGGTLYVVNLNTRELVSVPLKPDGTRDTSRALQSVPVPLTNPAGSAIVGFNPANMRPFAVGVKENTVYVGVTYTAETAGGASDLRAFVYAYNPTAGTFNPNPVLVANLNYARGLADDPTPGVAGDEVSANWRAWTSAFDTTSGQDGFPVHPQPWLTDIVFDGDNNMVLGIRDRFGDQSGFQTGSPTAGDDTEYAAIAVGDILRAAPSGSTWVLESNGSSGGIATGGAGNGKGPGNGAFFFEDNTDPTPDQVTTGGLAQVPGFHTVASTASDPISAFSGGVFTFFTSDTNPSPSINTAGTAASRGEVYSSIDLNTFGSSNGLGDLEAIPVDGTIQIGNRVFADSNSNGLQDPGELGIPNVVVKLFQGISAIATDTTDAEGDFLFVGLAPNLRYTLRIDTHQASLTGRSLTLANQGSDDQLDSDATPSGADATAAFTTGAEGTSNHSLDFGFVGITAASVSLGNVVFLDSNNNGTFDLAESGVPNVLVELLDGTGTPLGQTATTDANGFYLFTGLVDGAYQVRLAASNFSGSGPLVGFTSSSATSLDPNDDNDNDDNGVESGALGSGGFIVSGTIDLASGTEPITDGDNDPDTNLTLDFGVVPPAATGTLTLGNAVFRDANNNGLFDTGETGVAGVLVELLDQTGNPISGQTATTSASGLYTFTGLNAGTYRARLAASNFRNTGALVGFTPSSTTAADPNDDVNNNNDGAVSGTLGGAGFIVTAPITLSVGGEPTDDGDTDADTNLTLDFGVVAPVVSATLTVGDTVWNDANNNGLLDNNESGLPNISVVLVNAAGAIVQNTSTDGSGNYLFTGVAPGDYRIRLTATNFQPGGPLFGFTSSTGTNGAATGAFEGATTPDPDDNSDNDDNGQVNGVLGTTGFVQTALLTLALGTEPTNDGDTDANTNLTVDMGVFRKFSVGNTVFNDSNNNGTQDAGENGIPNVSVRLLDAGNGNALVASTTTNASGQYLFSHLIAGSYIAELAANNFNAGGSLFAFSSSTGTGNAFEPPPAGATDLQDHGTTSGILGSGGTIRTTTLAIGPGMPTGESPSNDPNTPDTQSNLTIDFGVFQQSSTTASISGRVFLDYNNNGTVNGPDSGMTGVTVTLTGGNLSAPLTVQTDASGNFQFSNLGAGTYSIVETQPTTPANQTGKDTAGNAGGTTSTPNTIANVILTATKQATGYTFAEVPILSTGGFVYEDSNGNGQKDTSEPGVSGVIVTLTGTSVVTGAITPRNAITDSAGKYTFANLTPGTYAIAESQPNGYIDGAEQNGVPIATVGADKFTGIDLTTTSAASGGFNFGEVKAGSISGIVYDDVNNDGLQATSGELGIPGVKIKLTGTNDLGQSVSKTTTTGSDGSFNFGTLRPGLYTLTETQPANYLDGLERAGTAGGSIGTNDNIAGIDLASGATAQAYLFGERGAPDLVVAQTPTSATTSVGGIVTLTYTVRNKGTGPATAASVQVNYGGMSFVSTTAGTAYDPITRVWTVGDVAAGATATIKITLRAPSAATFGPSARVSTPSQELKTTNNTATSVISAGVAAPPTGGITGTPTTNLWFLSSSTNARRTPRR